MSTVVGVDQRLSALERANEMRRCRVVFRGALRSLPYREAVLEAARVVMEDLDMFGAMRVYKFLEEVPEVGWSKARSILTRHQIYAAKPVRDLTERQRRVLAAELVRHAAAGSGGRWDAS